MGYREPAGRYRVETWGCQMNVLDGERMAGQLTARGYVPASGDEPADVIVLNTCHIRDKADHKVYTELGVLARAKRERPDLVIGVAGCVAQALGEAIFERAPFVDFVVGTGEVERVGEIVEQVRSERRRVAAMNLPEESPVDQFRQIARGSTFQAYVTVIEGCDQYCTFCVVPFTRGRQRSRRSSEILRELAELASRGYTEVTLLGQTVNAYRDPEQGFGLGELLRRASAVPGLRRVRFLTSHPRFVDQDLIEALASGGPIAPYLHLPAQSGSDRILYRMKRRYDAAQYRDTVARVRAAVPGIAMSSDFIVGFPGESEEDFSATLELVREVRFASLFGFVYSARPGTAAYRWGSASAVPAVVAAERLKRLLDLQTELQAESNGSLVGRNLEVLVESRDRKGQATGRTACNRIVHFPEGENPLPGGSYALVRIGRGLPNSLLGDRVA
ncbi:MAG TPA: tRNA (N6-isopentenyl adenosine(37)-C2)-methylthiotransferase MiaB [Thermoanaerobaculia bacterium]|nr:tRNA (N6-isopentenyl adenosine(37)-C2)-methylthiotransferase MiaB [Thermoanaerobaculia bacterium]